MSVCPFQNYRFSDLVMLDLSFKYIFILDEAIIYHHQFRNFEMKKKQFVYDIL